MTTTICSVDECNRTVLVLARGLCRKHYQRWLRHGSPLVARSYSERGAPQEFIEIALKHQDKETCLFWPYGRTSDGYAALGGSTERSILVSRHICERVYGPPPTSKYQSCHSCGKGHLGCVNPHHLRWDTPKGNQEERVIHGTDNRGERQGAALLTWEKVREIRSMKGKLSAYKVGSIFGVSHTTIYYIWAGKTWTE